MNELAPAQRPVLRPPVPHLPSLVVVPTSFELRLYGLPSLHRQFKVPRSLVGGTLPVRSEIGTVHWVSPWSSHLPSLVPCPWPSPSFGAWLFLAFLLRLSKSGSACKVSSSSFNGTLFWTSSLEGPFTDLPPIVLW